MKATEPTDDEASTLEPTVTGTMHVTCEVRGDKAMPRARKSKDDEPSTLTPTVIEKMHTTAEVKSTKAIPKATEPRRADHFRADRDGDDARDGRGEEHPGDTEGKAADDEPSTLMPTATETKHAMVEVRDTRAMLRVKESNDDEQSTLTPMAIETMDATAEVRGTKEIPRAAQPKTSRPLSRRRWSRRCTRRAR